MYTYIIVAILWLTTNYIFIINPFRYSKVTIDNISVWNILIEYNKLTLPFFDTGD